MATLIGPAVGGALVAIAGPSFAFALDAATFAVSALTLCAMRAPGPATTEPGTADGTADAAAPAPTLRTLFRTQRILYIILLVNIAANLGSGGLDGVALPALAHGPLNAGATGYGVILAAFGGGALLGTILVGQVGRLRRPIVVGSLAYLVEALCIGVAPYLRLGRGRLGRHGRAGHRQRLRQRPDDHRLPALGAAPGDRPAELTEPRNLHHCDESPSIFVRDLRPGPSSSAPARPPPPAEPAPCPSPQAPHRHPSPVPPPSRPRHRLG